MLSTIPPKEGAAGSSARVPSRWYYSKDGKRYGPVAPGRLKQLMDTFEVGPGDRVIGHGMKEWIFASEAGDALAGAPEVFDEIPEAEVAPEVGSGGDGPTIGYFNPTVALGPRTQKVLGDFGRPTGSTGESPLKDKHLNELRYAGRHEKALRRFNVMCIVLALATALFVLLPALLQLYFVIKLSLIGPVRVTPGFRAPPPLFLLITVLIVSGGAIVTYRLAGRAALRAKLWGPIAGLTLVSLNLLIFSYQVWQALNRVAMLFKGATSVTSMFTQTMLIMVVPAFVMFAALATMMVISIRAVRAVPAFLASPVWCQEALVVARM